MTLQNMTILLKYLFSITQHTRTGNINKYYLQFLYAPSLNDIVIRPVKQLYIHMIKKI